MCVVMHLYLIFVYLADVFGNEAPIRNMFGKLCKMYTFRVASSKKNSVFDIFQKELNVSNGILNHLVKRDGVVESELFVLF